MANPQHLKALSQGVDSWNEWRKNYPHIKPDLSLTDLSQTHLKGANLSQADLRETNLQGADLTLTDLSNSRLCGSKLSKAILWSSNLIQADLTSTNLIEANLTNAKIIRATLTEAKLRHASLNEANLSGSKLRNADLYLAKLNSANLNSTNLYQADLNYADFSYSNLRSASLISAQLRAATFIRAKLEGTDVSQAEVGGTIFIENDLSCTRGLDTLEHTSPSSVDVHTLYLSNGNIPEVFLRGCGLSDWQIESAKLHRPDLGNGEITSILYRIHDLRAHQAIQINPLFISYSHADGPFVNEVEKHLNDKGIRFWRDIHHATAGRLERQVDRAIRLNPTVLLVLSAHSVQSDWVQHEARLARKLEIETKRDVLCPVALDDSWKDCDWPERLREQIMEYNILDFSGWADGDNLRRMFGRLLDGLDLFYKQQ